MLRTRRVDFKGIIVNSVTLLFGFTIWRVLFNNYAREVFDISAAEIGIIQAVREVPGLLGFTVGLIALALSEVHIVTLSIAITGAGLIVAGLANSILMLGAGTLLMSIGFHNVMTANYSLLLLFLKGPESGRKQGVLASWEAVAAVSATLLVFLTSLTLGYRTILISSGAALIVAGIVLTFIYTGNRVGGEVRSFRVDRRYWLYYVISFLRGCRRHIFTTFAIFLLVANHGLKIEYTALLLLATSTITIYTSRQFGNLTEILGERRVLVLSSLSLVFIFTGYAFVTKIYLLIGLFVCDHVLFGSSVALNSYIRKVAAAKDLTSCMSFGQTANHITAVIVPIVGGIIWDTFGYRDTFLLGTAFVIADVCFGLLVNPKKQSVGASVASYDEPEG